MTALAHGAPAGGAPLEDVVIAGVVALVGLAATIGVSVAYVRGGARPLRLLAAFASRRTGMPAWAALPSAVAAISLITAVFGFYWDVATHIDNGRDVGPFANPSHYFIFVGLVGIAGAGWLCALLGRGDRSPMSVRIRGSSMPLGGFLILVCGVAALAGFPLDDVWHRLFGQDVTLWGPTHIQMVGGASLSTLGLWVLTIESSRRAGNGGRLGWLLLYREAAIAGAFLVGLSTLQGEFDYGVPQFRLLYHPVLVMLAASIGLVAARIKLGRWGALKAALFFVGLRALLSLAIGPGLGRITLHFPLYLVEAGLVELIATRIPRSRQFTLGLFSGAAIGTLGLAAEWAWSHVWMPIPWPAELLPEGAIFGSLAAVAGGVLGGAIGRSLVPAQRQPVPRGLVPAGLALAVLCLAFPAPTASWPGASARVRLDEVGGSETRAAVAMVTLEPHDAAEDALWFHALAWQGLEWDRGSSRLVPLEEFSPGVYRTTAPVPVGGSWKSLLRLHVDDRLVVVPLYLPRDPAISAPEVPAKDSFERPFVLDKEVLQREAITSNPALQRVAYGLLLLLGSLWIGVIAWGLRRLATATPPSDEDRTPTRPGRALDETPDRAPATIGRS